MKTPYEIYDEMPSGSLDDLTGKDILTLDQAVELAEKYHAQFERHCIRPKTYYTYATNTYIEINNLDLPENFRLKDIKIIIE